MKRLSYLKYIEELCIGEKIGHASELLRKEFGAEMYDDKIDDGGDERGTYVMKRCFEFGNKDVILYYLDQDGIVDFVEIRND
jgi:hypothetical protein